MSGRWLGGGPREAVIGPAAISARKRQLPSFELHLRRSKLSHHNSAPLCKNMSSILPCFLCQRWPIAAMAASSRLSSKGQFIILIPEKESHRHKRKRPVTAAIRNPPKTPTTMTIRTTSMSGSAISHLPRGDFVSSSASPQSSAQTQPRRHQYR